MFWGETVEAKKELYVECMFPLRLTKATLGSANDNERHFLKITYSDLFTNEKKTSTICVLQKNKEENVTLDLTFDQGEPITFLSTCTVHLSGYYIPEDEEEDDEDEDSDEDEEGFTLPPGWDEEDDESFRIEGGEDDEDDDDEDDDDDDDDEDDDEDGEPKIQEVDSDDSEEFNEEASLPADILKQIAAKQKKIAEATRKRKEPDTPQETPQAKKQKTETPKKDQKQPQQQQTPGKNEPQQKAQTPAKKQDAPAAAAASSSTPGKKAETPAKKAETPAKKAETPGKKAETPKAAPTTPSAAAAPAAATPGKKAETPKANKGQVRLPTGLIYEDIQLGTGAEAVPGKNVAVQYVGRLTSNNKVFDKSSGSPFTFRLGNGDVIKGWDQGVKGMKVGGKRKLVIPAELGYGKKGYPPTIPPNASLTFDVTLERIGK